MGDEHFAVAGIARASSALRFRHHRHAARFGSARLAPRRLLHRGEGQRWVLAVGASVEAGQGRAQRIDNLQQIPFSAGGHEEANWAIPYWTIGDAVVQEA